MVPPMSDEERALQARGLLPPSGSRAHLPSPADRVDLRDGFHGALLGGAIGDALGRPAEGRPRHVVRERYGVLRDFQPWPGYRSGPTGTYTDDTQLTICVADSLLAAGGGIDPVDLARRFVAWLPQGRGKGAATAVAVQNLVDGVAWDQAGVDSAGNGAAMRAAPVGLAHVDDVDALRLDAALQALITHASPMAVVSSVAMAYATAWCVVHPPGALAPQTLIDDLVAVLEDLHDPGAVERRPRAAPTPVRLVDRIAELPRLLSLSPGEAFDRLFNGAFVLESLPAALWCFLAYSNDPEQVIVTAANGGRDADTVAAMAGTLAGSLHGAAALPGRWKDDLEGRERLTEIADGLLGTGRRRR